MDEDAPIIEKIYSKIENKRDGRKKDTARIRKSLCHKAAYSRKQALTQKSTLIKQGYASYLEIYKCRHCRYWHLTSSQTRSPVDNELKKRCYNKRIKSLKKIDMNNVTSLTVVLGDGTIWTAPASAFTQVTAPAEPFVPTEAQVQAAVDAGIIAAYTPVTTSA